MSEISHKEFGSVTNPGCWPFPMTFSMAFRGRLRSTKGSCPPTSVFSGFKVHNRTFWQKCGYSTTNTELNWVMVELWHFLLALELLQKRRRGPCFASRSTSRCLPTSVSCSFFASASGGSVWPSSRGSLRGRLAGAAAKEPKKGRRSESQRLRLVGSCVRERRVSPPCTTYGLCSLRSRVTLVSVVHF